MKTKINVIFFVITFLSLLSINISKKKSKLKLSAVVWAEGTEITIGIGSGQFLRANGCTCVSPGPCGSVNGQTKPGNFGIWKVRNNPDGTISFESSSFPGTFLSLDSPDCKVNSSSGCGATYLNKGEVGPNQKFTLKGPDANGNYGIQSYANPDTYLRFDGTGLSGFTPLGGGSSNGQYVAPGSKLSPKETFTIKPNKDVTKLLDDLENQARNLEDQLQNVWLLRRGLGAQCRRYVVNGINLADHMYREAKIYHDIFSAVSSKIIEKAGEPVGWNAVTYNTNPWNGRKILNIGVGVQNNGNGIRVTVPVGYNVLWLRVVNDRHHTFRFAPDSDSVEFDDIAEYYGCGFRSIGEISPDGSAPDSYTIEHQWCPFPIRKLGANKKLVVMSDKYSDNWISGIAFGKNLWNHAKQNAAAYSWKLNQGTPTITYHAAWWNGDNLSQIHNNVITDLYVPVVPSGKDKLVYFVEHNNNWLGIMHSSVSANGRPIERFRTTYCNPFATHYNSKFYSRYIAARVPASFIEPDDLFIRITIDLTKSDNHIFFREWGSHDAI